MLLLTILHKKTSNDQLSHYTNHYLCLCTIKLPARVIENIDRARKQCVWRGNNHSNRGGNLVSWQKVQKPKIKGGLGVLNLRLQNDALLLKQLHKFYMKSNTPWCNLIWSKYYQSRGTPCYKRGGLLLGEGCSET